MGSLENEFYQIKAKAENGNAGAQGLMGFAYFLGQCVPQDNARAMMWFLIAKAGGQAEAPAAITIVESHSTTAQIADAQRMAREWWAAHQSAN